MTGSFRYNAFFGTNTLVNDNGNDDIFVAKLDSNGNWLWARQAGGQSFEMGMDIVVSNNSSIYLTGTFSDSVSLGSIVISACGPSDIFFAWMDINGNWLGAIGAGASSFNMGESIIATANGDIFVSGCFCENASFEGNILSSNGLTDIFIANIEIASPVSDDLGVPTPPFAIVNNYPNPFSKATKIVVEIEDTKDVYELSVYDLRGRKIKTLHSGALPKGESTFTWMADDVQSGNLPAGVYFYKLSNGTTSQTRKLVLVR